MVQESNINKLEEEMKTVKVVVGVLILLFFFTFVGCTQKELEAKPKHEAVLYLIGRENEVSVYEMEYGIYRYLIVTNNQGGISVTIQGK